MSVALLWVVPTAGVLAGLYWWQIEFEKRYVHGQVERELSVIADSKVADLQQYRHDLLRAALTLHRNTAFFTLVQRALDERSGAASRAQVFEWLDKCRMGLVFDRIRLYDAKGAVRMALPSNLQDPSHVIFQGVREVLQTKEVLFQDFYRSDQDQQIHLAILVPVTDGTRRGPAIGVVSLRVNPEIYIYPRIQVWPTLSRTAETLLVRRDGDYVQFLNELRWRQNTALELRFPLALRSDLPAALAVLGKTGIVYGRDYRDVPVVAALRAVPNSPWYLVTRMDLEEARAPAREKFWVVIALGCTVLLGSAAGMGLLWRRAQARSLGQRLEMGQRSLEEANLRFRELYYNMAQGVSLNQMVYSDAGEPVDYRKLDANPAYEAQTGLTIERIHGALASELFQCSPPPHLDVYERVSHGGAPCVFEDFYAAVNRHLRVSVTSAKLGFFNTLVEDITPRIQREAELRQKNAELERFTYTVSHDLKSPLVTIQTFVGFLGKDLESGDAERVAADLKYVHDAASKMSRLIDHLADVSRVGRVISPATRISLQELIGEVLNSLAGRILEKPVGVCVGEMDIQLHADRVRLSEIWQNLIENAVKYMGDQSTPRIEIGVEGKGPESVFFVRDNGKGIEPQYLERIFNLFEKLDPKAAGMGFGLALVRRIVELYQGKVWAESAGLGQGSCIRFTLPLAIEK